MSSHLQLRLIYFVLCSLTILSSTGAFYIPGYSIKSYNDGESLPLFVNKIFSDKSQIQYAYFDLPFVCPPTGKKLKSSPFGSGQSVSLNLGEILRGDRIVVSDFELAMGKDVKCNSLCNREISRKDIGWVKELISEGYVAEWIVDNLPGATSFMTIDNTKKYYGTGFKLGYQDTSTASGRPRYFLYNHFTFVIRWREAPGKAGAKGGKVIVGFEVYPKSITADDRSSDGCPSDVHSKSSGLELHIHSNTTALALEYPDTSYLPDDNGDKAAKLSIPYTYSVYFRKETKIGWSNRWELYLYNQQGGKVTHWLAVLNSIVISGVLGITVLVIWGRTAFGEGKGSIEDGNHKSPPRKTDGKPSDGLLDKGNSKGGVSPDDDLDDASAWKKLHGDVFRTPAYSGLLAPLVGSGMQLLFMAAGLLILSCLGVLNPSFRGGFTSVGMGLFVFAGIFSGYFSARLYNTFGGKSWRRNTLITATLFPGLLFSQVFVLNLFVWIQASSTALPFGTLVGIVALWLLIQVPLVYIGSWFGYEQAKPWNHPTQTNAIPRPIPAQPLYMRSVLRALLIGLIPFAVLFVELFFVFRNMLQDKSGYYYVFGYLSVVCTILLITVSEVTIIATYGQLCAENHNWWWQSFLSGGSSAFWIFLYTIWFFHTKLHIRGFVSSFLFFSYSFLGCVVYGLLTGTVGFLTAYAFIRRIYSSVKVD